MMMHGRGFGGFGNCFGVNSGYMGGYMGYGFMALIVILMVVVAFMVIRKNKKVSVSSDAMELLKMRYAKGEISEEEFIKKRNLLD